MRKEAFLGQIRRYIVYHNMNGQLRAHTEIEVIVQKVFTCIVFNNRSLKNQ